MTFVTDRTLADVEARNAKGTYNYTDLNRVISNCNQIASDLTAAGFPVTLTWSRTTWTRTQIPDETYMTEYLDNINLLKSAIPNNTPPAPASMAYLTYEGANDIERILEELDTLRQNVEAIYPRSGTMFSGAVIYEVTI